MNPKRMVINFYLYLIMAIVLVGCSFSGRIGSINDSPSSLPKLSIRVDAVASQVSVVEGQNVVIVFILEQKRSVATTVQVDVSSGSFNVANVFSSIPSQFTIPAGSLIGYYTLSTTDDLLYNGSRNFNFSFSTTDEGVTADGAATTLTILDNESIPTIQFSSASQTVNEGDGTTSAAITMTPASEWPVTVSYSFANGTGALASDYSASSGTVTFASTQATQTIPFSILEDASIEAMENFTASLNSVTVGTATVGAPSAATINIVDNDYPTFTINSITVDEGSILGFTVTLSMASAATVTVNWATSDGTAIAGTNYTAGSGTLTYTPGQTTKTISVSTISRPAIVCDSSKSMTVTLSSPTNATISIGTGNGGISDPDVPSLSMAAGPTTTEGGDLTFTASLSQSCANKTITANYATSDVATFSTGSYIDYTSNSGSISFSPGVVSQNITVSTTDDTWDENAEAMAVTLSSLVNAAAGTLTANGTINDNDAAPSLVLSGPGSALENIGTMNFTVTMSERSEKAVSVNYSTSSGTATSGSDFAAISNVTLNIAASGIATANTTVSAPVSITNDSIYCEFSETFDVTLSSPVNATIATASVSGGINDDDSPPLTISPTSVTEGGTSTVSASIPSTCTQDVVFNWQTLPGSALPFTDYNYQSGSLTIAANTLSTSFTVATLDDSLSEIQENLYLTAVNQALPNTGGNIGSLLINDNEGAPSGVLKIATGYDSSCALSTNGNVKCWGRASTLGIVASRASNITIGNEAGEMGDALPTVNLGTGRTAKKVVTLTNGATCAILDNNKVKCWGSNSTCQLGIGSSNKNASVGFLQSEMGDALPYVDLGTGRTATDLVTGSSHVCALLDNSAVKCWGDNSKGQLGLGLSTAAIGCSSAEMGDALPAVDFGAGTVAQVSTGGFFTCVRLTNGKMRCWGENAYGQLGYGDAAERGSTAATMGTNLPDVNFGTGVTATSISAGYRHTCAILSTGQTKCWGYNSTGQLGLGDIINRGDTSLNTPDLNPGIDLGTGRSASKIFAGFHYSCTILDNNQTKCWGSPIANGLGNSSSSDPLGNAPGEMGDALPAINLGTGLYATSLSLTDGHTCAVLNNNTGKCWGGTIYGDLGYGNKISYGNSAGQMGDSLPFTNVGTGRTIKQYSFSGGNNRPAFTSGSATRLSHTCAILDDNSLKCWGGATSGQLGRGFNVGDEAGELGLEPKIDLGAGVTAKDLIVMSSAACVITNTDDLKCWGGSPHNGTGIGSAIGDETGEMGNALPNVNLGTGRKVRSISATTLNICAILDNFDLKCWGSSNYGVLGYGDNTSRGATSATMGDNLLPVDLGSGRKAIKIVGHRQGSCALLDNGKIKCWGLNTFGTSGNGSTANVGDNSNEMGDFLSPIDLGNFTVADLGGVSENGCALTTNGQIRCWGTNGYLGHLVIGTTNNHIGDLISEMGNTLVSSLLGVGRTAKAILLNSMTNNNCFLLDNGVTKCSGNNSSGQLGNEMSADYAGAVGTMDSILALNMGASRYPLMIQGGDVNTELESHLCAVLDDYTAKCWASNGFGQLGIGDTTTRGKTSGDMNALPTLNFGAGF